MMRMMARSSKPRLAQAIGGGLALAAVARAVQTECAEDGQAAAPAHVKTWLDKWDMYSEKKIQPGFQQPSAHRWLIEHQDKLRAPDGSPPKNYFVPLCGKTPELMYLAEQAPVSGVECVRTAIDQFAEENGLTYDDKMLERSKETIFRATHPSSGKSITIAKTDFFDLAPAWDGIGKQFDAAWDRAANVAVEPSMRKDYAKAMARQMAPAGRVLLVGFEYDQSAMAGPPFSLPEDAIRAAYEPYFTVECIASEDVIDKNPGMRSRGLSSLRESLYLLERNDKPV